MTNLWTAPSDIDYAEGDLPTSDRPVDCDPEYENWLETHGYLDPPSDTDLELMRVEFEARQARPAALVPRVGVDEDDDIAF
jgi:hypothetical protein